MLYSGLAVLNIVMTELIKCHTNAPFINNAYILYIYLKDIVNSDLLNQARRP